MLLLLLFMLFMLIVFGECIVIGDIGIECSEGDCDECGMGDILDIRGDEGGVCVWVSFKVSFICSVSFMCGVSFICVVVGVNVGEEGLRWMRLVSACFRWRYFRWM